MKNVLRLTLAFLAFVMYSHSASASKLGYINSNELITAMPESTDATQKLQTFQRELETQMEALYVEYQQKLVDFQQSQENMTLSVRQLKEKELTDIQGRIQNFQEQAQLDMEQMQRDLMEPILEKARAAVQKVSKTLGLAMVFDLSGGALIYQDDTLSTNIMPQVKKELGVQ